MGNGGESEASERLDGDGGGWKLGVGSGRVSNGTKLATGGYCRRGKMRRSWECGVWCAESEDGKGVVGDNQVGVIGTSWK